MTTIQGAVSYTHLDVYKRQGLRRGMPVRDTGHPIEVPVGQCVLGRIFNVLGDAVDERGALDLSLIHI